MELNVIPYGRQDVDQLDIDSVIAVLKSDFLTQGPVTPQFEAKVSTYCGAKHAIAVNSATSALHIACLAIGVGVGDSVWTTPITFVASANCALYCGASVDFVDIDPLTYNMSVAVLRDKLEKAEKLGQLPKVVIPVHLTGQSCEMDEIHGLSKKYGFKIIEDASHAIGGRYQDLPVGSCRYSDITVFSFHPVKIITTAEGGMALTNDPELARKMALFRSHGITRDVEEMEGPSDGPWYYQQIQLGFNYRMTELQAALGLSQMERLDQFVKVRHKIFEQYHLQLEQTYLQLPWQHSDTYSSLHLCVVRVKKSSPVSRAVVFNRLRDAGVGVNLHYIPVYLQPYYKKMGFEPGYCPNAELYYDQAISLPMYTQFDGEKQQYVANVLNGAFE